MTLASYIFGIASALAVVVVIFEMLRRRRIRERHALWWFIAGALALLISLFPSVAVWAAGVVGVEVPSNLVFFVSIAILFLVSIQQSAELTVLEERSRSLAESVGLLELRVRQMEDAPSAPDEGR